MLSQQLRQGKVANCKVLQGWEDGIEPAKQAKGTLYTVSIASRILLRKVSLSTQARTQKSCTVSQLVCAFPNPV
jgi:hypothetical protein